MRNRNHQQLSAPELPPPQASRKKKQRNGKHKYKVRLVALGCGQEKDEEQQTFAPVVKGATISILFALPSCPICSLIGRTSFPHSAPLISDLSGSEEVYLGKLPDEEMPDGYCFRLRKARYGLRLSPRNWRSTSR